jgi:hypothetical protein
MRYNFAIAGALLLCTSCFGSTGGRDDGVVVRHVTMSGCDDSGVEETVLVADPAGEGAVHVEHTTRLSCCIDGVDVQPKADGTTLTLAYREKGSPCDCICAYVVEYDVSGLSSGDWTIRAQEDEAVVTVE